MRLLLRLLAFCLLPLRAAAGSVDYVKPETAPTATVAPAAPSSVSGLSAAPALMPALAAPLASPIAVAPAAASPVPLAPAASALAPAAALAPEAGLAPAAAASTPDNTPAAAAASAPKPTSPSPVSAAAAPRGPSGQLDALSRALAAPGGDRRALLEDAWEHAPLRGGEAEAARADAGGAAPRHGGLLRGPVRDLTAHGVPTGPAPIAEGEVLFWSPKLREIDPYLAGPADDQNMIAAKVRNEISALERVWLDVRAAVEGRVSPRAMQLANGAVVAAARRVERDRLKAEVALEKLQPSTPADEDALAAARVLQKELVPALKNRAALVYLGNEVPDMDLDRFHADLKRLEKERVMTKIHERFLRLAYGFDAKTAAGAEEERSLALARRMAMGESFGIVAREIEAGRTGELALDAVIADMRAKVEFAKSKFLANAKNLTLQKNLTSLEEFTAAFEAVKEELRAYDYVYEPSDLADIAKSKKEAEFARHERAWAQALKAFPDRPADVEEVLRELEAHMRAEVLGAGRPLSYAAAEFFARRAPELEELAMTHWGASPLDVLMAYSHASRVDGQAAAGDRDIVAVARAIRDEADYQDLRTSFRGRGRVVGIVTTTGVDDLSGGRMPHWVIFAKADGIVPVPWVDLKSQGGTLAEIAQQLSRPNGQPGTALLDGRRGQVSVNPSPATRAQWLSRGRTLDKLDDYYRARALRPVSFAGAPVRFLADEAAPKAFTAESGRSALEASGAAGVGLLRMEKLMMELGVEWDEAAVSRQLEQILSAPQFRAGAPAVVRLFDFEGDKVPKFVREAKLDERALLKTHSNVRFYLDKSKPEFREFGKMQLRAMFEAHRRSLPGSNLRILFSNVRGAAEIRGIEELIKEASAEYVRQQKDPAAAARDIALIPIGYMVEEVGTVRRLKSYVAALAKLRRATRAERFIAIGTNDYQNSLLQGDPRAIDKLSKLDPRMVSGIWAVAEAAGREGIEVTIDGEWGSSPKLLLALMALRAYHRVSATPVTYTKRVPELSELIRSLTDADLRTSFTGRKGDDLKTLLKRIGSGRMPSLEQFDRAVSALADALEDRVLSRVSEPAP